MHFGANDKQAVVRDGNTVRWDSLDWDSAYRAEVRSILETAAQHRIVVYWLGPAPDRSNSLNAHVERINPIIAEESAEVRAQYFPLGAIASDQDGGFTRSIRVDGRNLSVRSGDGTHFSSQGYTFVADKLLDAMERRVPSMFPSTPSALAGVLQ